MPNVRVDLKRARELADAATPLAQQHIAGHDRPRDEYCPECLGCNELMELGPDCEPTAFCDACAYKALDATADVAVLVPALLDEVKQLRAELGHATAHDGDWLSKTSRAMCETVLGQREALRDEVTRLRARLALTEPAVAAARVNAAAREWHRQEWLEEGHTKDANCLAGDCDSCTAKQARADLASAVEALGAE